MDPKIGVFYADNIAQQASTTLTCLEGLVIPRAKSMRRLSDTQKIREKSKIFRV
ncbi:MAG: hypothetical protein RLZZ361_768 [Cyanobacteriota bacterium]